MVQFTALFLGLLAACVPLSFASPVASSGLQERAAKTTVHLRIELEKTTIYDGLISTSPRDVTTASGGTHHCDGTNNGANPVPGPTCTSALADFSALSLFPWDGTYDSSFDDYFVTRVGGSTATETQFWGALLNWQFIPVGGCQQQVATNDSIVWAFDAFNKVYFLKLDGPTTAKVGVPIQVSVTDGPFGDKISGASVAGTGASASGPSDVDGRVTVTFASAGTKKIKAQRADSLRSNSLTVVVTA
ncbi:hypothetical protein BDV93DRAFT_523039 [Ceratobasidium sp. AG-I]|nr:hypothetical protein BDV93DRAFT_523039 [Ceratobasidium sp. AG-I]